MKQKIQGIGKSGSFTSIVVKKSILKKLIGGTYNCQEKIDEEISRGRLWLQLNKLLQNIHGKGIATMIGKIETNQVVVKIQLNEQAQQEFNIQSKLKNLPGFIQYNCIFTCGGNKEYIEQFSNVRQTRLCKEKGDSLGIIVMPYYANGSLDDYIVNISKEEIKNILIKIIQDYTNAYRTTTFVHGDLFCKNIILDDNNNPIIIDFEKSQFNYERKCDIFWNDLDNLCIDISRNIHLSVKMYDIARVLTLHRAYNREPTKEVIDDLIKEIEKM